MLNTWSFKAKLMMLCLFLSSLSVAVGGVGYFGLKGVSREYGFITEKSIPKIRLADQMYLTFRRIRIRLRTLGMVDLSPKEAEAAIQDARAAIEKYELDNKAYVELGFAPGQKEHYDRVNATWSSFKEIGARVISLYQSGKPEDRAAMMRIFWKDCPEHAKAYTAEIEDLLKFHREVVEAKIESARSESDHANLAVLGMILTGLSVGLGVGIAFSSRVSRLLGQVSRGLSDGADEVGTAAASIAAASQQLSSSATEQAAALQETTAAVEETSAMISKNADNAQKSTQVSTVSQGAATQGKQVVNEMITSIEEISRSNAEIMSQIETSNREMSEIVQVITEIGAKTKVINDIVFQTKLLSFNASVEAARAGEQGKGFAVVAEEVGNLAQMSGNAAREITEMLEGSIKKVEQIVTNTRSRVERLVVVGKEKVEIGTATAKRCGDVLDEIVKNVTDVGTMVSEISSASQEQARGVAEINKAMSQLDQVAQQNNSASQGVSVSAQSLRGQVGRLREMVGELNRTVQGAERPTDAGAPSPSEPGMSAEPQQVRTFRKVA